MDAVTYPARFIWGRACMGNSQIVHIDPFQVPHGAKSFGYVNVTRSHPGVASVDMPVGVINGTSDGPTMAVTAGLFAHEYCGIEAASRVYQRVHPGDLSGRLIVVPIVDMPCFQFRTPWLGLVRSVNPLDGAKVNTLFPGDPRRSEAPAVAYRQSSTVSGDPSGSVAKLIASKLFHGIILRSDYHVDLRGGDLDESHMSHTIFLRAGLEIDAECEELAKVFGSEYVLPGTGQIGHTGKGTLIYEAMHRGVASIISESGLGYRTQPLDNKVEQHVVGVTNLLIHLRMIAGNLIRPQNQQFLDTTWHWIPVPVAGVFHAMADEGDIVKRDQLIGRITDIDGSELCRILSPIDGIVHCMFPRRLVSPGDDAYTLLKIAGPTGW